jgi:DNA topoisomerase I
MVKRSDNHIPAKRFAGVDLKDIIKSDGAADLVYVNDRQPGFSRQMFDKNFIYFEGENKLHDREQLDRIDKLSIPPAWKNVWICKFSNGHIQATGYDLLGRKQYRYHTLWIAMRTHTKFSRMQEFGKRLSKIRSNLEKDLSLSGFPQEKVLAAVVSLLEKTHLRVGNEFYEKFYGSFGLTTLKDRHVKILGTQLRFSFNGKKGIHHNITFRSKKLSRIVKGCKEIPGSELFVYYNGDGKIHRIDSGMVNDYIRKISGSDFTAKDFRTWSGTMAALLAFNELGDFDTVTEMNHKMHAAFDLVALQLGNTRTVCKKYYVHPVIVELYKAHRLKKYIHDIVTASAKDGQMELVRTEKVLLKVLRSE